MAGKRRADEAFEAAFGGVGGCHGLTSARIDRPRRWLLWSNGNRVVVHYFRIGRWIPTLLELIEIQPDRVGDQITHLILRFPGHADARQFRHTRPYAPKPYFSTMTRYSVCVTNTSLTFTSR